MFHSFEDGQAAVLAIANDPAGLVAGVVYGVDLNAGAFLIVGQRLSQAARFAAACMRIL